MAVLLAVELNQRESDVLTLSRSAYDGIRVAVRREKTGTLVKVLATQELKDELDAITHEHATVVI